MNSRKRGPKKRGNAALEQRAAPGPSNGEFAPSEAILRGLFEKAPVGIFVSTIPGKIVSLNASGAAMFGYASPEEFAVAVTDIGKQLFVFPEQREELRRRALESEDFVRGEVSYRRKDGSAFMAHLYVRVIRDGQGEPRFLEGFIEDITERKQVEAALQQSETRFRTVVENAPVPIGMARNGIVIYVNKKYVELFRCKSAEARVGRPITEIWAPEYRSMIEERTRRGAGGLPVATSVEGVVQREDGSQFPVQLVVSSVELPDGPASLAFFTDITERKRVEAALQRSESQYRTLVENAPLPIGIARNEIIVYVNKKFLELYRGESVDALVGRPITDFWAPEFRGMIKERGRKRAQGLPVPTSVEGIAQRADGSRFPVQLATTKEELPDGPATLAFFTDITELKRAEAALQQSEARYRTLVESAPLPIAFSRDGIIVYANPKSQELFRCQGPEALVGRRVADMAAPEYRAMIEERGRRRAEGLPVSPTIEAMAQREDGSQFPVQVATTEVALPDGPGVLGFFTDISELKQAQAELSRHQEHLEELVTARTAELHTALADLEHMSYSMVHDMRAPLRAMQGFAHLIEAECPECRRPPVVDYLQRIGEAAARLDRLITDALSYNKVVRQTTRLLPVDLRRLLQGMVHTYPNLQPEAADISIDLSAELVVRGNESLLTQCFGNLLDNAVKFVGLGVRPKIRVWAQASALNGQPSCLVYVADNGIGIPKEGQENIFGMFQRLHHASDYPGTGIGLAIVRKAVERMGGRVSLESEPGQGSTFCVELPSATQPAQARAA